MSYNADAATKCREHKGKIKAACRAAPCANCIWLLEPTFAQAGLDPLQLVPMVCN